jgi:hypothetical protein
LILFFISFKSLLFAKKLEIEFNKLLFFFRKEITEEVERKELLNINDWISVNEDFEAKLIKEKDFHRTVTLED